MLEKENLSGVALIIITNSKCKLYYGVKSVWVPALEHYACMENIWQTDWIYRLDVGHGYIEVMFLFIFILSTLHRCKTPPSVMLCQTRQCSFWRYSKYIFHMQTLILLNIVRYLQGVDNHTIELKLRRKKQSIGKHTDITD